MLFPMIGLGSTPRKMMVVQLDCIGFEENATFP
ncbi:hypothetical protein FHR88_002602 [Bradyrhizobium betae]|nr:hypothetical protein [Bradyrhizobium betae]